MKRALKIIGISLAALLAATIIGFLIYASLVYRADGLALDVFADEKAVEIYDGYYRVGDKVRSDTAIIFYPGAKVEPIAYLPLMQSISQMVDVDVFIAEMPLNFAIFNGDAALHIIEENPQIENWYISGHSLGAVVASQFAKDNEGVLEGIIIMGAYLYGDYPPEKSLTIYGSMETSVAKAVDYDGEIVVIEGGNHAEFGNYGEQYGYEPAEITREEQQRITAEAVAEFVLKKEI